MKAQDPKEFDTILFSAVDDDDDDYLSDEALSRLRPAREVLTEQFGAKNAEILISGKAGRPVAEHRKQKISLRLDTDVLNALKARNPKGWQTEINAMLRRSLSKTPDQAA